jgi:restriction system protein
VHKTSAWVIRGGRQGEREQWALANRCSGGGRRAVPDITACFSREHVAEVVRATEPTAAAGRLTNITDQLWSLRSGVRPGDVLVMPLKTTRQVAIGRVTSGYRYRANDPETDRRHVVGVDWQCTDLPRAAIQHDLLSTLGRPMSVFAVTKNHAVARLEHLLEHGTDPGCEEN